MTTTSIKQRVTIGLLGTALDNGKGASRWERWRPSVDAVRHDDLLIDRFELLYEERFATLFELVKKDIESMSPETEVVGHTINWEDPWDFEEVYSTLHDFARSYEFDMDQEDYLIHMTNGTHVAQICLFLLTETRYLPARLLQTAPPSRQRSGMPGSYSIIDLDLSRYDRIAQRFQREQTEGLSFLKGGIETRNASFNGLIEQIEQVAIASHAPILLTGPTGAGKSQLARRIYELKRMRRQVDGEFVEVNCATIRGDAAMSALFGHTKGAFTGANRDRPGLLRAAHNGMLFLDEIGELGLDEQTMLLRAIEEKRFLPVGADTETSSDFQLIAGTNRNLLNDVAEGRFREDLLARINLWTFELPGLSERREDIEPNLLYELERYAATEGNQVTFNKEARNRFLAFAEQAAWNGNFRDLNAAITRMATLAPGGRINRDVVAGEIDRLERSWVGSRPSADEEHLRRCLTDEQIEDLDLFDRVQLNEVLRVCTEARSLSEAGRTLFSESRKRRKASNDADRLRKYLLRHGIEWDQIHA